MSNLRFGYKSTTGQMIFRDICSTCTIIIKFSYDYIGQCITYLIPMVTPFSGGDCGFTLLHKELTKTPNLSKLILCPATISNGDPTGTPLWNYFPATTLFITPLLSYCCIGNSVEWKRLAFICSFHLTLSSSVLPSNGTTSVVLEVTWTQTVGRRHFRVASVLNKGWLKIYAG